MQPQSNPVGSVPDVSPAASIAAARELWYSADFHKCLAILDEVGFPADEQMRAEVQLLRARSLYRLRRFSEVVEFLGPLLDSFSGIDESCTARMLHASALTRSNAGPAALDRGIALLAKVATAGEALRAHRAIRAEIAHARALAYWIKREPIRSLQFAVEAEAAQADVISVRATQLRGFVALTMKKFSEALALFRSALAAYRTCHERDDDLEQATVLQIASLELTLRSSAVVGTHNAPWGRTAPDRESAVASVTRMQLHSLDAWLYGHDGDRRTAFRKMRLAVRLAPTQPWKAWALAQRAAMENAFGNVDSARENAAEGVEIADAVDWNATVGEERMALLFLAEVLAAVGERRALGLVERYDSLKAAMNPDDVLSDDPRRIAFERHIRGLAERLRGNAMEARGHFIEAHRIFSDCGHLWRATVSLIELDATPVSSSGGESPLEQASKIIRAHFPQSFLIRRLGRWLRAYDDPLVSKLTPARRDVLRYLLDGWGPKEIARIKGLAEGTVRNVLGDLEAAFGVHSIQELVVACYQRGLGTACWSDDFDPTLETRSAVPRDRFPWLSSGAVTQRTERKPN